MHPKHISNNDIVCSHYGGIFISCSLKGVLDWYLHVKVDLSSGSEFVKASCTNKS